MSGDDAVSRLQRLLAASNSRSHPNSHPNSHSNSNSNSQSAINASPQNANIQQFPSSASATALDVLISSISQSQNYTRPSTTGKEIRSQPADVSVNGSQSPSTSPSPAPSHNKIASTAASLSSTLLLARQREILQFFTSHPLLVSQLDQLHNSQRSLESTLVSRRESLKKQHRLLFDSMKKQRGVQPDVYQKELQLKRQELWNFEDEMYSKLKKLRDEQLAYWADVAKVPYFRHTMDKEEAMKFIQYVYDHTRREKGKRGD
jgi:hypothetical protein